MLTKRKFIPAITCFMIGALVASPQARTHQPTTPGAQATEPSLEDRIGLIKISLAQSQAALRKYEWIETTSIFLKGEEKSRTVKRCYYGVEGKVQKVVVEAPAAEAPKRGIRGRIVERKKEELADYVVDAVELVKQYVPPTPERIQVVKDDGRASVQIVRPGEQVSVVLAGYHKPEDSLAIQIDMAANRLLGLEVNTYLGKPISPGTKAGDPVTMKVTQSTFPDGTLYTEKVELFAPSKDLKVVVEHSGYRRVTAVPARNAPAIAVNPGPGTLAVVPVSYQGASQTQPAAAAATAPELTDIDWPRVFEVDGKRLTIYQPQVDSWDEYRILVFRCAISVEGVLADARFGVAEIEADTVVDHGSRMVAVTPRSRTVRFANVPEADAAALVSAVDTIYPRANLTIIALDRIMAYIDQDSQAVQRTAEINLDPPRIYHSDIPAILVTFPGKPVFKPVVPEKPNLLFAINTNWDVLLDSIDNRYYLLDGEGWITTTDPIYGKWTPATSIPFTRAALPDDENWAETRAHLPGKPLQSAPRVFVATQPAELIVTDGPPVLDPIPNTTLSRVSNTDSILFRNAADQKFYMLAAGRWFSAGSLEGPWAAASASLPADFASIPPGDESEFVKASVPGTQEAKDAVLLASVPNTTVVSRTEAPVNVEYGGTPKFVVIDGTDVSYATNTSYSVFLVGDRYYCCDQGAWFVASAATGPWAFCTTVPPVIYSIPPSNPHYNVTYVTIQSSTPETVTYTQTSGYSGEYVAKTGVLMFGAGILVGALLADDDDHYYAYPCHYSYGSGARYHYGYGGFYAAGHGHYGPYGGAGFAAGYNPVTGTYARSAYAYGPRGAARTTAAYNPYTGARAVGGQVRTPYGSAGRAAGYNPSTGTYARAGYSSGKYGSAGFAQVVNPRTGTAASVGGVTNNDGAGVAGWNTRNGQGAVARTESGDIYASRNGNVYKRESDGDWSSNSGSGWQPAAQPRTTTTQTSNRSPAAAPAATRQTRTLDSEANARQRGNAQTTRSRQYQSSSNQNRSGGRRGR